MKNLKNRFKYEIKIRIAEQMKRKSVSIMFKEQKIKNCTNFCLGQENTKNREKGKNESQCKYSQ